MGSITVNRWFEETNKKHWTGLSFAVLGMLVLGDTARAQVLEEIVVTSQRREQSLQDVPISVTVFDGTLVEKAVIRGAHDYLALTPNVSFTEDGQVGSRGLGIAIRGINNLVSGENAVINSVGIYLDEFSVSSVPSQVANPFIPDMERIEILRGPQGTFFGRNALGGAINLTSKNPTDELGGRILVGGETYENAGEQFNLTGIVNVPVSDGFRLRGVAYYEDSSGRVRNICRAGAGPGECPIAEANNYRPTGTADSGHEYLMARLKAAWDITEDTSALLTLVYNDETQGHDDNVPSGILDLDTVNTFSVQQASDPGTGFWPDNRNRLNHDRAESTRQDTSLAILNIRHQFNDNLVLKWITGIVDSDLERLFDNDLVGGADIVVRENFYQGKSWSTELRFEGNHERLDWIAGALYSDDEQTQENNVFVGVGASSGHDLDPPNGLFVLPPWPAGLGLGLNSKSYKVESVAAFADITFRTTERLDLILGGRYTYDTVKDEFEGNGFRPTCCFPFSPGFPGPPSGAFWASFENVVNPEAKGDVSFKNFSPRFGIQYAVSEDVGIYALVSRGYKAGGTRLGNSPEIGAPAYVAPFDEETMWNYELGMKSEWLDRRVRLNGAIFYLDWEGMQFETVRALRPGPLAPVVPRTINLESATSTGGEIELLAIPTESLTISAGLGYQDTEIDDNQLVTLDGGYQVSLQGLNFPKAPKLTFNATADYRWPIGDNDAWVRLEWIYRDGQYSDVEALTNQQTLGPAPDTGLSRPVGPDEFPYKTPDYNVLNLRVGYDTPTWNLIFYVQNLADEKYYTGTQENFGASGIRLRPHPRVFGVTLGYRFGGE